MTTLPSVVPERLRVEERASPVLSALGRLGPAVGLACVIVFFTLVRWNTFATVANWQVMLMQTAVVGTAALGMTLVIISGGIDLSVGSNIAMTTVAVAMLLQLGWPPAAAAACAILAAAVVGLLIGALVVGWFGEVVSVAAGFFSYYALYSSFPARPKSSALVAIAVGGLGWWISRRLARLAPLAPFIITLGLWGGLRGFAKWLAGETTIDPGRDTWLNHILHMLSPEQRWTLVPPGVWMMAVLSILMAAVLRYTRFGRHVFAIGSNELTARLCGVPVARTKVLIYILSGIFAGLAGILQFSSLTIGDPTTANGKELDVIAAVVIGGASLSGGQGTITGSLIGALLMTVIANGCTKMGLTNSVQEMVTGGIIILAATVDRLRRGRLPRLL